MAKVSPQMADLSFGGRMRIARGEAGLTQPELARRLGKARETVSAWENNHQDPGITMLRAIAEELDVSADWLLFGNTRVFRPGKHSSSALGAVPGEGTPGPPIRSPIMVRLK